MLREETTTSKTPKSTLSTKTVISLYEKDLRTRLSTFPRDAQTWYYLACHLRHERRFDEAEIILRHAIELNPAPQHFWSELAVILESQEKHEEANEIWAKIGQTGGSDSLQDALSRTKKADRIEQPFEDNRGVSPCLDCSKYTYYGCSQGEPCGKYIVWRACLERK